MDVCCDLDKTTETPLIPIPSYKLFTLESLQEQLKYLNDKAESSEEPEKLVMEIERCKTKITNLRGEQAIYDSKKTTKNMFRIVKNIDKVVNEENKKRNVLIQELLKDHTEDPEKSSSIKKEIDESLEKSLLYIEEKKLLQKRTSAPFSKKFYEEQEMNLIELRTQINALAKNDEIMRKSLEQKRIFLMNKENELRDKEKFIFES